MKKQARYHVNRKLSDYDRAPAKPSGTASGELAVQTFDDIGRQVTVYVPPNPPEAIVFPATARESRSGGGYSRRPTYRPQ